MNMLNKVKISNSMKIVRFGEKDFIPAAHEDQRRPGAVKKVLFTFEELIDGRVQMINWAKLGAGKSFRPHYHEEMHEIFIIVKGTAHIEIGKKHDTLYAGDCVVIPPGGVHAMTNSEKEDVEYIVIGITTGKAGKTIVTNIA